MTKSPQTINSLNIFPQNPSEKDSIYITVNSTFSSSSCDTSSNYLSLNNNTISASSIHCLGMASALCDATDTFLIGGLTAGSYTFIINVNQGFLPSCTPGIVPGPTDTLNFNVSIDMPAGPSELLVVGDSSSNASFIASDLLSQAEHGIDSQVILVSTSKDLIKSVKNEILIQVKLLTRKNIIEKSLKNAKFIYFKSKK